MTERVIAPHETVIQQLENARRENRRLRMEKSLTEEVWRLSKQNAGEVQRLKEHNDSLTGEIFSMRIDNQTLREETHSLEAVIETIRADVATLTAANEQLSSENRQLRSEIQSLRRRVQGQPSSSAAAAAAEQPWSSRFGRLFMHDTVRESFSETEESSVSDSWSLSTT